MTRVAILIDGGYFLKRLPTLFDRATLSDPHRVDDKIGRLVNSHLTYLNNTAGVPNPYSLLYRCFFYDALPYTARGHRPVSKQAIDYSKSKEALFRGRLFELVRRRRNFALRLGKVYRERAWVIKEDVQKDLLDGRRTIDSLTDSDFKPVFRQKAVDMRIGLDIASITLKKQADTIILVAGDADFVPAAKLARREGVQFILDPLWQQISPDLFEHIDGLRSGFPRPGSTQQDRPDMRDQTDE